MPETEYARRVSLYVSLDGYDISGDFAPYLLDFTYTDNASGKTDEVQITLHNRDGRFSGEWLPRKGMEIEASIICSDWEAPGEICELPCGTFKIDELDFTGPPDKIAIKAVSADLCGPLRDEKKTRAWENLNLEGVAGQIAKENGLELYYSGPEHRFERQDQRNEGDIAFLNRLCGERSMNCKVHKGMIVLFDADEAEKTDEALVIPKTGDLWSPSSYSFKISSAGTDYTDAEIAYADPKTGTAHKAKVKSKKATRSVDGRKKTLTVQKRAESAGDAATLGKSELHAANVKEQSANVEIMGCPNLAAGQMVLLDEFGEFSGKYFIKTATHKVSGSGKYSTSLELETAAPTEAESAHDEKSEAALAAREEVHENERARIAQVKIYRPGSWPLSDVAGYALHRLEDLVEEARIKAQSGTYAEKIQAKTDSLILCLADIAENEAKLAVNDEDREGWLYLRDMFLKWLSAKLDGKRDDSPLIVKWDWLLKFRRVREAYNEFIQHPSNAKNTILNKAAKTSLGQILFNEVPGHDAEKRTRLAEILKRLTRKITDDYDYIEFDFINAHWDEWELLYYTLRSVDGWDFPESLMAFLINHVEGLSAALSTFTLRALASGHAEKKDDKWQIFVEKVGIFAHDIFNFGDSGSTFHDALGCWNCRQKRFVLLPSPIEADPLDSDVTCLSNAVFRDFSARYGFGRDFLVLSMPRIIELHKDNDYEYPL